MQILITGGMGFVGTAIVDRLAKIHRLTVVDRGDFGVPAAVEPLVRERRIEFIRADLTETTPVFSRIADGEFDVVVHLAALHYIPMCEKNPLAAYQNNVMSSLALLTHLPVGGRLVNFSTAAVYKPEDYPHREDASPILPLDVYGLTKKHVEDLAVYYAEQHDLAVLNIRLFNAVGPGETNPHLLPAIISQLQKGKQLIELGNLYPKRDFIAITDIAWVVDRLLQVWPVAKGSVENYNVGSGTAISVGELFQKVIDHFGRPIELRSVAVRQRRSERALLCADTAKLRHILPDFCPQSLDQWMPRLIQQAALRIDAEHAV